jgi:phosphocarrier protein HPr
MMSDPMMAEQSVQIRNKNGLHARPAAEIVKAASKFKSDITISREDMEVNGKSIMGVMMLAAEFGATITLRANGPDAGDAIAAIASLVERKFGET